MEEPPGRFSSALAFGSRLPVLVVVVLAATSKSHGAETDDRVSANVLFAESVGRNLGAQGAWLPVYVELESKSRDGVGIVLEGSVWGGKKTLFQARAELIVSPGAPRRAWTYVWVQPSEQATQRVRFDVLGKDGTVIRTGDEWSLTSSLGGQPPRNALVVGDGLYAAPPWPRGALGSHDSHDPLPPRALPDSVIGFTGFDVVIFRNLGREPLERAQLEALRQWVYLGGFVVLSPAVEPGPFYESELARMLLGSPPAMPVDRFVRPRTLWLESPDGTPRRERPQRKVPMDGPLIDVQIVDPVEARGVVEIQADCGPVGSESIRTRLYAERAYGNGRVGIACPVMEGITRENVDFLKEFWTLCWTRVRSGDARPSLLDEACRFTRPSLRQALDDPSRDVGLTFIAALVLGYLILIGPVLYFVLKRRNRFPSVIWVEPLLVVAYLGVIFAVGYMTKGVLTKTRVWTLLTQVEGETTLLRESYLTVFSGTTQKYRIDARGGVLLRPIFTRESEERAVRLVRDARFGNGGPGASSGTLSLVDYELAQWEQAHFVNYELYDPPTPGVVLTVSPATSEAAASATVENNLPYAVAEGVVRIDGSAFLRVPRVESGQRITLSESTPIGAKECDERFEWWSVLSRDGLRSALGAGGPFVFAATLEREVQDFRLDRRSSLREKRDLYVLYRSR